MVVSIASLCIAHLVSDRFHLWLFTRFPLPLSLVFLVRIIRWLASAFRGCVFRRIRCRLLLGSRHSLPFVHFPGLSCTVSTPEFFAIPCCLPRFLEMASVLLKSHDVAPVFPFVQLVQLLVLLSVQLVILP
ncbi:hypothetical protein BDW59DRAFT_148287 [Aspergillus cavernicola]|uniref:Uncharacterized protein n=1 Tax=Aspergillus cavernicola TaxID=176166 RepID=A0ABR4I946_9EURO